MSLSTSSAPARPMPGAAVRLRVDLVCAVLVLSALALVPIGLAWPTVSDSGTVLGVHDVRPVRDSLWVSIMLVTVLGPLNVGAQAIAVLTLVREKAAAVATWGAVAMMIGTVMESVGLAGLAGAYFYPSDPAISRGAATQVYDAIGTDHVHLLVLQLPGHLLLSLGVILQAAALLRARVVPRWVPLLTLAILLTYAFPGSGALGLVSVAPLTAGCISVAYFARRRLLVPRASRTAAEPTTGR
jgi:hypothetical protein